MEIDNDMVDLLGYSRDFFHQKKVMNVVILVAYTRNSPKANLQTDQLNIPMGVTNTSARNSLIRIL